jgi:hypothetical protein
MSDTDACGGGCSARAAFQSKVRLGQVGIATRDDITPELLFERSGAAIAISAR